MRETLQAFSEIGLNWAQLYKLGLAVCDRKLKIVTYRIKTIFLIWKSRDGMYLIQTGCSFYLEVICPQRTDYSCSARDPSISCFRLLEKQREREIQGVEERRRHIWRVSATSLHPQILQRCRCLAGTGRGPQTSWPPLLADSGPCSATSLLVTLATFPNVTVPPLPCLWQRLIILISQGLWWGSRLWVSKHQAQTCVTKQHRLCQPLTLHCRSQDKQTFLLHMAFSPVISRVGMELGCAMPSTWGGGSSQTWEPMLVSHFPVSQREAPPLHTRLLNPPRAPYASSPGSALLFEVFAFLVIIFSK